MVALHHGLSSSKRRSPGSGISAFTIPRRRTMTLIKTHFPIFDCPSDVRDKQGHPTTFDLKGNYAVNWGSWNFREQGGPTNGVPPLNLGDEAGPRSLLHDFGARFAQITDGTSNTLMWSEVLQSPWTQSARHGLRRSPRPDVERRHLLLPVLHAHSAQFAQGRLRLLRSGHRRHQVSLRPDERRPHLGQRVPDLHGGPQPASQRRECHDVRRQHCASSATTSTCLPGSPPAAWARARPTDF